MALQTLVIPRIQQSTLGTGDRPTTFTGQQASDLFWEKATTSNQGPNLSIVVSSGTALSYQNVLRTGNATLVAGTVTVADTRVTAASRVFATHGALNGSTALGVLFVGTITPATSFVLTAGNVASGVAVAGDTSVVNYILIG